MAVQDRKKAYNDIHALLKIKGWSLTKLVEEINKMFPDYQTTVANFNNKLHSGTLRVYELSMAVEVMGFKMEYRYPSDTVEIDSIINRLIASIKLRDEIISKLLLADYAENERISSNVTDKGSRQQVGE